MTTRDSVIPSHWTIIINDGENITARNIVTKEVFTGTKTDFTNKLKASFKEPTFATYATDYNGNVTGLITPDGSVIGAPNALTSTRSTTTADNGVTLSNATASNYTVTVKVNTIAQATMLQQESTGTITLVAGAGVTFIGASLATAGQGGILTILPTSTANTYIVKLSA